MLGVWLKDLWRSWTPDVEQDALGNVYARVHPSSGAKDAPQLMITAHMDTIGLVVSRVEGSWLWVRPVGGLDPRVLPGQRVRIWGRGERPLTGVVTVLPESLRSEEQRGKGPRWEELRVDVGLSAEEVAYRVSVGTLVTLDWDPVVLDEHWIVSPGLDNRASLAALTGALAMVVGLPRQWEVVFVATVQEETSLGGAWTAAQALEPQVALVVDVTFGQSPDTPSDGAFPLGQGVTLGWGAHMHPAVYRHLEDVARAHDIPVTPEYLPMHSGTEAAAVQLALEGLPTGLISIPLRYMHTPVETVHLLDIYHASRLLSTYAASLDEATLHRYRERLE